MQFLSDVSLDCDACKGKRFKKDILEVRWNGKNIDEVLGLSVTEACLFFAGRPEITKKLYPLIEVGLGYLKLGQPTTTLSGGELQRIKLAYHLVHEKGQEDPLPLRRADDRPPPERRRRPPALASRSSSTKATPSSSSSTTWTSSRAPTTSSTSAPRAARPAAGSSPRERPEKVAQSRGSITAKYLKKCL